jgi:uncharacterized protein (DUF362 family)/Pyruvate/2-oxoacid:ferredoxin oxidoreductase delta subunit
MKTKVSLVRCENYDPVRVQEAVRSAVEGLGGVSLFIKPGSKVLVKPNLLMAMEPGKGITTHPEVVRAVIRLLKDINCMVLVGDSPSAWGKQVENIAQVFHVTGMKRICEEEGVPLIEFDKKRWVKDFPLAALLGECDHLVNVPKFKTHGLTLLTGAVKNLFGLIPGAAKAGMHKRFFEQKDFVKMLVDILQEAKPSLSIVDGIVAMEGDGPGSAGRLRDQNVLVAGNDAVAVDSVLALIMGLQPEDILTTREAAHRGLGVADPASLEIVGERIEDFSGEPFVLPATSIQRKLPKPLMQLAMKLIKYYPCVERDNCVACAACIQACPQKVIRMHKGKPKIDYSKCISCFCCQEVCPHAAIKIRKSFLGKLAGL